MTDFEALSRVSFGMAAAGLLMALPACTAVRPDGPPSLASAEWVTLFDGETLNGWTVHGGAHEIAVAHQMITGVATAGEPSAFLITQRTFSDFILEVEFLSDGLLNSGIMFRAASDPDYRLGRLFGYQAEIDPSPRGWTGGLFEEAMRGWLYRIEENEACRASFRQDQWNTMRIEAFGPSLRTFVNGVPCAELVDDNLTEGVIGLQVHSVSPGGPMGSPGNRISFRNIRIMTGDAQDQRNPR